MNADMELILKLPLESPPVPTISVSSTRSARNTRLFAAEDRGATAISLYGGAFRGERRKNRRRLAFIEHSFRKRLHKGFRCFAQRVLAGDELIRIALTGSGSRR